MSILTVSPARCPKVGRLPRLSLYFHGLAVGMFLLALVGTGTAQASSAASGESSKLVQSFFDYLLKPGTNVEADPAAQAKWLGTNLKALLTESAQAVREAQKLPGVDGPDPKVPDNDTFLDSWDYPSVCKVESVNEGAGITDVHVLCTWGAGTNYPGLIKKGVVSVAKEAGEPRITAIRWQETEYSGAGDVVQNLETLKAEALELIKRGGDL